MKKKIILILTAVVLIAAVVTAVILINSGSTEPAATPDASATPDEAVTQSATEPPTEKATESPDSGAEQLDLFETFPDLPTHFVTHGGRPGEEGPSEYYLHATVKISDDGTISGEFFTNLESTENETIEHHSTWIGTIRDNTVYRNSDGVYYFYIDDVSYKYEPETSETVDGKTVNYVYGFGLDPEGVNRFEIYTPETVIDSLNNDNAQQDIRQFLSMMQKDGEGETLGCYLLRGADNNSYVSITDEEASMGPPEQQPDQPDQPPPPQ